MMIAMPCYQAISLMKTLTLIVIVSSLHFSLLHQPVKSEKCNKNIMALLVLTFALFSIQEGKKDCSQ